MMILPIIWVLGAFSVHVFIFLVWDVCVQKFCFDGVIITRRVFVATPACSFVGTKLHCLL